MAENSGKGFLKQTNPRNCLQTCIANLLGLTLEEVPDFVKDHEHLWASAARDWLRKLGLDLIHIPLDVYFRTLDLTASSLIYLAIGGSPRSDFKTHAILMSENKLFHDPHESDAGITDIRAVYFLVRI